MKIKILAVFALALLPFGALAQPVTLLSNSGNPVDGGYSGLPDSADPFTTGSEAMTISSINVVWEDADTGGVHQVGIYTDSGGFPNGAPVGSFFTNPNPTVVGSMTYSGNAVLQPNTDYWMVVDISDNAQVAFTNDDSFVAPPSTQGAVIVDGSAFGDSQTVSWFSDPANLMYELIGTAGDNVPGAASPIPVMPLWILAMMGGLLAVFGARKLKA